MMNRSDILIIGAGAAGLIAAKELSKKGKKVTVLEAKPQAGGRISTLHDGGFLQPVEGGAEFIHGNLPITLGLLKEAGIKYTKTKGKMVRSIEGKWKETDEPVEGWGSLMQKMNELQQDTTLTQFLNAEFADEKYDALRQSALQYAQGFDAVDPDKASVFALREEWQHDEEDTYRIEGGYVQLIHHLLTLCKEHNAVVLFNKPVAAVEWKRGGVIVTTPTKETFYAQQAMVTVPVGVLAADEGTPNFIQFKPQLPQIQKATKEIGYGNVIKILLQFSSVFWQKQKDALFFISDQTIATWWSQQPSHYPLLTGWIAGKKADEFTGKKEEEIKQLALQSLANIFNKNKEELTKWLTACYIVNWQNEVYAKGAYSFNTVASEEAKKVINEGIENTLFFGGEALYSGASGGTVEAALVSGLSVAKKIIGE